MSRPLVFFSSKAFAIAIRARKTSLELESAWLRRRLAYRRARCLGCGLVTAFFFCDCVCLKVFMVERLELGRHLNSPARWDLVGTVSAPDRSAAAREADRLFSYAQRPLRILPLPR